MGTYQKKPIKVEAVQWNKYGDHPSVMKCDRNTYEKLSGKTDDIDLSTIGVCGTLEGLHLVSRGDYIITGIKGEIYPCKPDIFEESYDLATSEDIVEAESTAIAPFCGENISQDGKTAGGHVNGNGFTIVWHDWTKEPFPKPGELFTPNGTLPQYIVEAAIFRLEFLTRTDDTSEDIFDAIAFLKKAVAHLDADFVNKKHQSDLN